MISCYIYIEMSWQRTRANDACEEARHLIDGVDRRESRESRGNRCVRMHSNSDLQKNHPPFSPSLKTNIYFRDIEGRNRKRGGNASLARQGGAQPPRLHLTSESKNISEKWC